MKKDFWKKCLSFTLVILSICTISGSAFAAFVAYNDTVGPASGSLSNVTHYSGYLNGGGGFEYPEGYLKDFDTGSDTSIWVKMEASNVAGSLGSMPNPGTDAYDIFNGIVNINQSASYNSSSSNWYYKATFSGLDPNKTYEFVTTANRNESSYDGDGSPSRWTEFSIIGADTYANSSSIGVFEATEDVLKMNTGYNTEDGYVIKWTGISAADGEFTVLSQNVGTAGPGESTKSYGMQAFVLTEIDASPVPIPGAVWLFGSGVIGLVGLKRRFKKS